MYGSYPPSYLKRVTALFPDAERTLHLFSGSLPRSNTRQMLTVDSRYTAAVQPGVRADVLRLPLLDKTWDLAMADPPYTPDDAEKYETPMPDRRRILYEIHRVLEPGGFLVWLDTVLPMFSSTYWRWCGAISLWRSTNHRIRGVMLFERLPQAGETYPGVASTGDLFAEWNLT